MTDFANNSSGPADVIPLEQVDGLDVTEGLERCINDRTLYRSVLLEFRASYGDVADRLDALQAEGRWSEAEKLTHAIKGSSGMLSANDLFAAVSVLDATLKLARDSKVAPPGLNGDMQRFCRELNRLIAGIDSLSR